MTTTLRILHQGTEPLDGHTPLSERAIESIAHDRDLGMSVLVLPPGTRFGLLEPRLVARIGAQSASTLRSFTLLSHKAPRHEPGCTMSLRPPGFGDGKHDRVLLDLGAAGHREGLYPMAPRVPCPLGHAFVFDTTADGEDPGPHLVQLTFEPARLPAEIGSVTR